MSEKQVSYRVKLQGSDGKEYIATIEWLKDQLGLDQSFREGVIDVEEIMMERMLIPEAKKGILTFLRENPDIETRKLHDEIRSRAPTGRLSSLAWWRAFSELEKEGQIISVSQGRGKTRKWRLKAP